MPNAEVLARRARRREASQPLPLFLSGFGVSLLPRAFGCFPFAVDPRHSSSSLLDDPDRVLSCASRRSPIVYRLGRMVDQCRMSGSQTSQTTTPGNMHPVSREVLGQRGRWLPATGVHRMHHLHTRHQLRRSGRRNRCKAGTRVAFVLRKGRWRNTTVHCHETFEPSGCNNAAYEDL